LPCAYVCRIPATTNTQPTETGRPTRKPETEQDFMPFRSSFRPFDPVHLVVFNRFPIKTLRIFTAIILVTWSLNHSLLNFTILKTPMPIPVAVRSVAARLLTLWVRIPPGTWICVCCECCVLSGRGLCDELITRPEESYRLWCVVACDLETS